MLSGLAMHGDSGQLDQLQESAGSLLQACTSWLEPLRSRRRPVRRKGLRKPAAFIVSTVACALESIDISYTAEVRSSAQARLLL